MNSDSYLTPPPLYALIIGINAYTNYPTLYSAVKDADDFTQYLITQLRVPPSHIIGLRDSTATRSRILSAFDDLKNLTATCSELGDTGIGIIIFFAGHGTRGEWPKGEEEWEGWNEWYEAICSVDMGDPVEVRREREVSDPDIEDAWVEVEAVPAIPDRTVAALLNDLSETRGNNITLILDCCHSAGATRHSDDVAEAEREGYVPRHITNPPPLPPNHDAKITDTLFRSTGGAAARGFSGKNMSSHVLLAACGREQIAREHPGRPNGVFTYALMKVLNEARVEELTYTSLMHRLNMPKWQNAHCEGTEINRRLFNHRIPGGDPSFILGIKRADKLIMDVGTVQGITVGCAVSIHESNLLPIPQQPNPALGTLTVSTVTNTLSTLSLPGDAHALPLRRMFYCKVIERPSESLAISSNNLSWLKSVFSEVFRTSNSVTIVHDMSRADFVLTLEGDTVYIDHRFVPTAGYISTRSPFTIPSHNVWMLHQTIKCVINFRYHLVRSNPDFSSPAPNYNVGMEMRELEISYGAEHEFVAKSTGRNLFEKNPAVVVVESEKRYGVTVNNQTTLPFYPHLFYFDPSKLSITPWYLPPTGAGASVSAHKTDTPLQPKSEFRIGYHGDGSVDPWVFALRKGERKDIGFFKLFVTTAPASLGSIAQECPYDAAPTTRTGQVSALLHAAPTTGVGQVSATLSGQKQEVLDVWDMVVKAVVQLENGTAP